jgi:hypothetical protein
MKSSTNPSRLELSKKTITKFKNDFGGFSKSVDMMSVKTQGGTGRC